jgi:hypothetical protein
MIGLIRIALVTFLAIGIAPVVTALADLKPGTCDQIEKTYAEHEKALVCSETFVPNIQEYSLYRAMCFGCDPDKQYFGDDYTLEGTAFSEARGAIGANGVESTGPLDKLPRVPSPKTLLSVVLPGIDGVKCRDDKNYMAAHPTECSDLKTLADAFFGTKGESEQGAIDSESKLRDANSAANSAVIKAIQSKKGKKYHDVCTAENKRVGIVRENHRAELAKAKDAVWTNVLNEIAVKRGCLAHYIEELPTFWCKANLDDKGELPATNKDACLKGLSAKPADLLAKFKDFVTDPTVLLARTTEQLGKKSPVQPGTGTSKKLGESRTSSGTHPDTSAKKGLKSGTAE